MLLRLLPPLLQLGAPAPTQCHPIPGYLVFRMRSTACARTPVPGDSEERGHSSCGPQACRELCVLHIRVNAGRGRASVLHGDGLPQAASAVRGRAALREKYKFYVLKYVYHLYFNH